MLLWALACTPPAEPVPGDTDTVPGDTDTNDTDDTDDPTGETGDTGPIVPTGDTAPELDCSVLPSIPVAFGTYSGWGTAEDFDLDALGFHVSVNNRDLLARAFDGTIQVRSPGLGNGTAGTRVLPTGDWVVATGNGSLVLVDGLSGAQTTILSGLSYPNGVEVDYDNMVFVAEQDANRVRQVDPYTGQWWEVGVGLNYANGVILSTDSQTLFVGSFGAGKVYAVDRLGPTDWDTPRVIHDRGGFNGGYDGIAVDACNNVYITEYLVGKVYRISHIDGAFEEIANLPSSWIPNMRWGHGLFGWETDVLYVSDRQQGRIFTLQMGIQGKKHVLAP